jgi:acyl carrier protein
MSTELLQNIEKAIRDVVNNQTLAVKADSRLISDLGLESIDLLDVSSELENTIGQELDFKEVAEHISKKSGKPADMKAMRVQDLIDYIQSSK